MGMHTRRAKRRHTPPTTMARRCDGAKPEEKEKIMVNEKVNFGSN